jgi:mono/diheme cytochrome c family protein
MRPHLTLIATVALLAAANVSAGSDQVADYQRCAACHLPTGEGIPGAFPPIKGRVAKIAASDEGRSYLVSVVNAGLMGSITVDGISYMGVMPAQGSSYDAAGISDVLNYSVQVIDQANVQPGWKPFSAEEVTQLLKANAAATSQSNGKLREALLEQYPELQ